MLDLVWLSLAREDLLAIVDYISEENPDAALHLLIDIKGKGKGRKIN